MAGQFTSGTVTVPGLSGSGTDFNAMIDKLYEVESLQAQQLIKWKNDWQLRKDAFTELRTELVNLQSSLKKLNSVGKFLTKTATSSAPQVATATLSESSEARNYTIFVEQLAQAGMMSYKTNVQSATDALGSAGTFKFKTDSMSDYITLEVTDQTTLQGLVAMINGHSENKSVTASLINTGDGQMLQLRSKETGANTNISIETQGIGPFANGSWEDNAETNTNINVTKGANARFTLDGNPTVIEYHSNIVKDIIPGITFNLFGVSRSEDGSTSAGPATISVSLDKASIKENVQAFVDSINTVRSLLNELTTVNTNKSLTDPEYSDSQLSNQYGSILTGNYGIQLIASKLKTIIASSGIGFDRLVEGFTTLSQIGIMTNANQGSDNYGLLEINEVHSDNSPYGTLSFDEALDLDPEGIARLFASTNDGHAWGDTPIGFDAKNGILSGITKPGTYEINYTVNANGDVQATIGGYPAAFGEGNMLTCTEGPAKGLAVTLYDLTEGSHTANVSIRQGKVNELLSVLQGDGTQENSGILDKTTGSLSILEDNYTKIMSNINEKIMKENDRLVVWERRMRSRFARLESTLARYNSMNDSLKSQIESLGGGSSK